MDQFLGHYSYLGLIAFLVLTGCGLPIPEEVGIIAAGVLSSAAIAKMDPVLAFSSCMIGALLGDAAMYGMGRYFGRGLLKKKGWLSHVFNAESEARTEAMIRRHGLKVFFVARFLVGVRAPMYVAAGILHVPFRRFLFIDAICATTVVGVVFGLSYAFGEQFQAMWRWFHRQQMHLTVAIIAAVAVAVLGYWLLRRRRAAHLSQSTESDSELDDNEANSPKEKEAVS